MIFTDELLLLRFSFQFQSDSLYQMRLNLSSFWISFTLWVLYFYKSGAFHSKS